MYTGTPPAALSVQNSLTQKKEPPFFTIKLRKTLRVKTSPKDFTLIALTGDCPKNNFPALSNETKERQSQPQIILDKENNASDIQNLIDLFTKSFQILMSQMETESPDISNGCDERSRISPEIEGLDIIISRCTELVDLSDTDDN
ncbi:hypothetical protein TNCV_3143451 [Trichonephila clavipes]|nr:hypothetical protein TNCV_3143451 [Trichonephila clavipes]